MKRKLALVMNQSVEANGYDGPEKSNITRAAEAIRFRIMSAR